MSTLKYILRHGWFWPLEFWLRPFAVQKRIEADWRKELSKALTGSLLSTLLLVVLLWLSDNTFYTIWIVFLSGSFFSGTIFLILFITITICFLSFIASPIVAFCLFVIILSISMRDILLQEVGTAPGIMIAPLIEFAGLLTIMMAIGIGRTKKLKYFFPQYIYLLFIFFWLPSMMTWHIARKINLSDPGLLHSSLHILSISLAITPLWNTGFIFYPLFFLITKWLYHPDRVLNHSDPSDTPLINFWQSLALPLPGLKKYLALVVENDIKLGYETLRTVQTQTFQRNAARKAAQSIIDGRNGLIFAGYLAIHTNPATLRQLLLGPFLARSVAILLAVAREKIKAKDLILSVYTAPVKNEKEVNGQFSAKEYTWKDVWYTLKNAWYIKQQLIKAPSPDDDAIFYSSQQSLKERLSEARSLLSQSQECTGKEEYNSLLNTLEILSSPENFQRLYQNRAYEFTPNNMSWLQGGWQLVIRLEKHRAGVLQAYQSLSSIEAKKTYLGKQQERLKRIDWSDLPWFWVGIAQEIVEIWDAFYEQEIKETREWLLLEISPETDMLRTGNATLNLRINNKSGAITTIAQQIQLHLEALDNIVWCSNDLTLPKPLQGQDAEQLRTGLFIKKPGRYVINGTLTALDLDERSYEWPVNFVIHADEKGQPYQLAEKQYYIVGSPLSNDLLFIGRKQLLRDIRLLWREPANKEALLLIGLRRMGKSSLLQKIRRDGINDKVIPLLIDLQGKATQHAFLQAVVEAMAAELTCQPPALDQTNPGPAFEQFLRSLIPRLTGRSFLLMIDEANFFARRDYGELPHLLRSLMQAPDVPLLLLFCGTYELRQGARDYDSILYNTTRTKNVSYFNPTESAEVLTRPVRDFLEYDPQALQLAFQLTHGHPLLLQALGDQLIQTFNDTVLSGKERSNYVTYGDMEQAGKQLSQKENPAFGNYWEDADIARQKILVVMAAGLDETSRKRGSLEYLLNQAAELRIPLERKEGFKALDQLTQEEQLTYADGGYSFMVALYRRWILWHYPPERFRESL